MLTLMLLIGCMAEPSSDPASTFEYVWADFDDVYGPFEQRGVDWEEVYDTHAPDVHADMSDDELWTVLTGMVTELDDGHVRLVAPGRELFESNHVYRDRLDDESFDLDVVVENYLTDVVVEEGWLSYTWGLLEGGVPYAYFPNIDDNTWVLNDILDEHSDAPGLVIDLRHNGGGSLTFLNTGLGRLTSEDVLVWRSRSRVGAEGFSEWMDWTLQARGETFEGEIVVLVDAWTISAGERATMMLMALPNTTVVGVPTNGSIATMIGREAPNGWYYSLPVQEVVLPDGREYEGEGLPVDVEILNDPAVLAEGEDQMLEAALDLLR